MTPRRLVPLLAACAAVALVAGCAPEPDAAPAPTPDDSVTTPPPTVETTPSPPPAAIPTTPPGAIPFPADCRELLSEPVLSELGDVPLNDPALGPSGLQPDGSLICIWRDAGADTTGLVTTLSRVERNPALDILNAAAAEQGLTCYTPAGGTRCDGTFPNPDFPVTDGRTMFWRDDVLVDTRWSNLAPAGYTDSIIQTLFF